MLESQRLPLRTGYGSGSDRSARDFRTLPQELHYRCHEKGFNSIAIAQINNADQKLGSYTLLFVAPRKFSTDERRLFDAVGQHLGVAIEN